MFQLPKASYNRRKLNINKPIRKNYVSIFVTVNLDAGKDGNNYYVLKNDGGVIQGNGQIR